jgi:hypothetical protein
MEISVSQKSKNLEKLKGAVPPREALSFCLGLNDVDFLADFLIGC